MALCIPFIDGGGSLEMMPATPDGFREIVLDVHGRVLATAIAYPSDDPKEQKYAVEMALVYLGRVLLRKC